MSSITRGSWGRARIGITRAHEGGPALVELDVDRASRGGPDAQHAGPEAKRPMSMLAAAAEVQLPRPDEPLTAFEVELDPPTATGRTAD